MYQCTMGPCVVALPSSTAHRVRIRMRVAALLGASVRLSTAPCALRIAVLPEVSSSRRYDLDHTVAKGLSVKFTSVV